jgi:hypothetical protein
MLLEDDSFTAVTALFLAVCALYIFGSITVGIISRQNKLGFRLGFVWSLVFTPIIGLYLVMKSSSDKKTSN